MDITQDSAMPDGRNLTLSQNAATSDDHVIPRYRFPDITPPSVLQAQRRNSSHTQQHVQRLTQQYRRSSQPTHHPRGVVTPLKPVYKLMCRHCTTPVCARGMKAILLADNSVELYSTDTPSQCIHVLEKDYLTRSCHCRIRDVACLECGNILGYHVVSPCMQCLESCNNGHFWMFHSTACKTVERQDKKKNTMLWSNLPRADLDLEFILGSQIPYDQFCR